MRKATLASVLAKAGPGIRFNEHLAGDGPTICRNTCLVEAAPLTSSIAGLKDATITLPSSRPSSSGAR